MLKCSKWLILVILLTNSTYAPAMTCLRDSIPPQFQPPIACLALRNSPECPIQFVPDLVLCRTTMCASVLTDIDEGKWQRFSALFDAQDTAHTYGLGLSVRANRGWFVFIRGSLSSECEKSTLEHELAHVLGWRH